MIDPAWLGLLIQVPLVGLFMWFVLYWQRSQQANVQRNHEEWRAWLNLQQEASEKREDERQRVLLSTLDELRKWNDARDGRAREQNLEVVTAMVKVEQQLGYLTNITLLVYASVNRAPLPDEITRAVKPQ